MRNSRALAENGAHDETDPAAHQALISHPRHGGGTVRRRSSGVADRRLGSDDRLVASWPMSTTRPVLRSALGRFSACHVLKDVVGANADARNIRFEHHPAIELSNRVGQQRLDTS